MTRTVTIDSRTWSFEEEGVRFFLLAGEERALLIDSGMTTRNARELAEELTDKPITLLNTHADPDHIGSNGEFSDFLMSPAEAANYYKLQGRTGSLTPVWDGQTLDLGARPLKIVAIPGHTPGSIGVLDVRDRRLFSGDPVQDGRIFMFGPQREFHAYVAGLRRLQTMIGQFDRLYPSHGSCPVGTELIGRLIDGAEEILAGERTGERLSLHGRNIEAVDVGCAVFLCDAREERP